MILDVKYEENSSGITQEKKFLNSKLLAWEILDIVEIPRLQIRSGALQLSEASQGKELYSKIIFTMLYGHGQQW